MELFIKKKDKLKINRLVLMAIFLAYATIMGIVERWIPFDFFVPGVKLGLANVVILTSLYIFSFPNVLLLVISKCIMSALFAGSFSSFLYSISGSILSFVIMFFLIKLCRDKISPVGISVIGAVFHNLGQILAAAFIIGNFSIAVYLPVLIISGVVTGILVGVTVSYTIKLTKYM